MVSETGKVENLTKCRQALLVLFHRSCEKKEQSPFVLDFLDFLDSLDLWDFLDFLNFLDFMDSMELFGPWWSTVWSMRVCSENPKCQKNLGLKKISKRQPGRCYLRIYSGPNISYCVIAPGRVVDEHTLRQGC